MSLWIVASLAVLAFVIFYRDKIHLEIKMARSDWKGWGRKMWKEWGEPFLVAAVIALVIRTFALGPYKIPSSSMYPTLKIGDKVFVDKLTYRFRHPRRGDVVVFRSPTGKFDFVKRLIAFEGEEVEIRDGVVYIDGRNIRQLSDIPAYVYYYNKNDTPYGRARQKFKVPDHSLFVLGDNSQNSNDSRYWGFVPNKNMIGKAFMIWWPLTRFSLLH